MRQSSSSLIKSVHPIRPFFDFGPSLLPTKVKQENIFIWQTIFWSRFNRDADLDDEITTMPNETHWNALKFVYTREWQEQIECLWPERVWIFVVGWQWIRPCWEDLRRVDDEMCQCAIYRLYQRKRHQVLAVAWFDLCLPQFTSQLATHCPLLFHR